MKILITGAAGSIGSELVRQLYKDHTVYALDINETGIHDLFVHYGVVGRVGDVRDYDTVNDVFADFKPDKIFHAAAYKHVEPMEVTPLEAIKTNVIGTYNLLHCSKRYEVPTFVYISTDKAIHSNSVMGATKRLGEIMVKNQGYTVVRFGNVLGSRGSVIPIWQRQINEGKNITITDPDMTRYFMTIEEACELVIQAGNRDSEGEIMILDMGEPIKIIDLAKRIIAETKSDSKIDIVGRRSGETMHEKLMLDEERAVAFKVDKFFIVNKNV
jgi:FlaA1/EpsC-like NDP-sugar epimerase